MEPLSTILEELVQGAAEVVRKGGIICYPTETLYGIGGSPYFPEVIDRIHALKGRGQPKPLLVLTDCWERALPWIQEITPVHHRLMTHEPPLPVTLLFISTDKVPEALRVGSPYVGIRRTTSPIAQRIIARSDSLLISTSANPTGEPPPLTYEEISPEILAGVDFAIDIDQPLLGVPSTVLRVENGKPVILREGALTQEDILRILNQSEQDSA